MATKIPIVTFPTPPTPIPSTASGVISDTGETRIARRIPFQRVEVSDINEVCGVKRITISSTDAVGKSLFAAPVPFIVNPSPSDVAPDAVYPRPLLFISMSKYYRANQEIHLWAIKHDPLPCTIGFVTVYGRSPLTSVGTTPTIPPRESSIYEEWDTVDNPKHTIKIQAKYRGNALYTRTSNNNPTYNTFGSTYATVYMYVVRPYMPGTIFPPLFDIFISSSLQDVQLAVMSDPRTTTPSQISCYYPVV